MNRLLQTHEIIHDLPQYCTTLTPITSRTRTELTLNQKLTGQCPSSLEQTWAGLSRAIKACPPCRCPSEQGLRREGVQVAGRGKGGAVPWTGDHRSERERARRDRRIRRCESMCLKSWEVCLWCWIEQIVASLSPCLYFSVGV